jgi:hypothetical protein
MSLSEDTLEEIQYRIDQGFDTREDVCCWVLENQFEGEDDIDEAELRVAVDRAFEERLKEMESWPPLTDCDRLRAAFEVLDQQGIVALENAGLTLSDAITNAAEIAVARERAGRNAHGYALFTWNDLARAIDGQGLSLAYGTFEEEPPPPPVPPGPCCPVCDGRGWIQAKRTEFPSLCACKQAPPAPAPEPPPTLAQKVGALVVQACRDAGLGVRWDGAETSFVELPEFRWQRRLPP